VWEIIVRMGKRASVAVGALLACCGIASALNPSLEINQYAHTAWTIREGFFKGAIYAIAQTPDGYLWLGTEFGLLRFDGVRSFAWQPPAGVKLPSNYIRSLLGAHDGRLWIGTDNGLASWKDGKLTTFPELAGQFVVSLHEDREGTIWAGGIAPSIGKLCAIRNTSTQCYGDDGSFGQAVLSTYELSDGTLWVGASTGLWRWKPGPPKHYPTRDVLFANGLIEGGNGVPLIAASSGILQLVGGKLEAYRTPGVGQQIAATNLMRDRNGGLWVAASSRGLLHVRQGGTAVFTRSDGLSGDDIFALYEDHEGSIWVATESGLDRFRDFAVPTLSVKQGLSNSSGVWSVLATRDGSVWVGTRDGLNKWHDGQITIYRKRGGGSPEDAMGSLFRDDRGRIWVSTLQGIVYLENGQFIPVADVPGGVVRSFAGDEAGNLWISHQDQGLFRLLGGKVVERIPWNGLGRKDWAEAVLPDPLQGGLWLGFFRGGVAYLKDGKIRASYMTVDGLGEGRVDDLEFDEEGALWIATQGGLSRMKSGRVATLTSMNGLPCDEVHWAREDNDHSFWLYTACGLVRITRSEMDAWAADPRRKVQATIFDSSDGVRSRAGSFGYSPSVARSADGKLWFLPGDGVSVLDPHNLPLNKLPPPVHIEQITADRKSQEASPNLRLPPLVRDLEIDYTALSLVAPEKNRFRVKLEGRDPDWKDVGNERKAFYNDLPPRNYRFRVMASNNNGVWNEAGASFDFSVDPAYYQTRWFQASCVAAFLGLLWALYRLRLHQIAQGFNARMEERVAERTRLARDLHDTLLQGFQGLMLRLQALDDLLPAGEAKEELEQTLDRADQVVAEGRKAVHNLRLSTVVTNDLARAVNALGDELSREDSATFGFLLEGQAQELHPIVRDEVYRITREALRNAFSHARARHIEAEIIYAENLFRLRIRDDGEGIAPAILEDGRPGHYGLPGMRERAAEIGAKLDIWSGVGTGTEVDLSIAGSIAYGKRPARSRLRVFPEKGE
jgi:signal transduction histidine kinase/ligand-binding sensor domain-containing protein